MNCLDFKIKRSDMNVKAKYCEKALVQKMHLSSEDVPVDSLLSWII